MSAESVINEYKRSAKEQMQIASDALDNGQFHIAEAATANASAIIAAMARAQEEFPAVAV